MPDLGPGTFPKGIHPDDGKRWSAEAAIEVLPTPKTLMVPLVQHLGAPSKAVVKIRDEVQAGQVLSEPGGFVSAGTHAPLAGKVGRFATVTIPNGRHLQAIPIAVGPGPHLEGRALYDAVLGGAWTAATLATLDPKAALEQVRAAGLVGMGGAAFPTHVKLAPNAQKPVDTVLVNGCECEPYLTSDARVMIEAPVPVVLGALIAARICGATRVLLASERSKAAPLAALDAAARAHPLGGIAVQTVALDAKYPMGGEKQTVRAAVGRTIPDGGLPLDVGVVVINVSTCVGIAGAVLRGRPFTHRVMSVTGPGVVTPKNLLAPVGASVADLVAACGGLTPTAARLIAGGPMMGFALGSTQVPVTKGTSGITVLTAAELAQEQRSACIRCGRCVEACPLDLVPARIALASRLENWDLARRHHILSCMECGCCAFVCPAGIPLVQLIRQGKTRLPREAKNEVKRA